MTGPPSPGEGEKQGAREYRHKTLSAYYPRLYTLHDYLLSAPISSSSSVLLSTDGDDYRRLVEQTICALRHDSPVLSLNGSGSRRGTQQELVDSITAEVSRRSSREGIKDILVSSDKVRVISLTLGYR
jgi:hypothetical protein